MSQAVRVGIDVVRGVGLAIGILAATANAVGAMPASSQGYGRTYGQGYGGSDGQQYESQGWPALSDDEIAALRSSLGPRAPLSVVLVYRPSNCAALEQSFGRLFDDLHWPRADAQGALLDENPDGLTLMPDSPDTRDLKDAIEAATQLRLDVRGDGFSSLRPGEIILIVGERQQQPSGRVRRPIDGGCQN